MSLILEAINRSTQERQAQPGAGVPGLDTPAYVESNHPGRPWVSRLPWLALVVAAALIGYLLLDKFAIDEAANTSTVTRESPRTSPPHSEAKEAATQLQPQQAPASRPRAAQGPSAAPQNNSALSRVPAPAAMAQSTGHTAQGGAVEEDRADAAVAALYGKATPPAVDGEEEHAPEVPEQARARTEAATPASQSETELPPRGVDEEPIDMALLLERTEEGLKNARLQEHSAPFIADLSQQKKNAIPSILYRHHDYSSNSAQSSVVLNGKRLKVGQTVVGSIKLEEILPGSIVLNQRGEQFRLRALNSWVNL
jgi:general secretion pathway protein B